MLMCEKEERNFSGESERERTSKAESSIRLAARTLLSYHLMVMSKKGKNGRRGFHPDHTFPNTVLETFS